jgi:hypothetical protein
VLISRARPIGSASSVDVSMGSNVYIGLAITSHIATMQASGALSNVATSGNVTGHWQSLALGVTQPSNDIVPLYVAVEDKADHKRMGVHPNPDAVTSLTWQQWRIPLSDFKAGGVPLAAVKKLFIGAGDRANSTPSTGLFYLDGIGIGHPASGQ